MNKYRPLPPWHDKKNSDEDPLKKVNRKVVGYIVGHICIATVLFVVISFIAYIMAWTIYRGFVFYGDELIYKLVHFFNHPIFIIFYFIVGFLCILTYYILKVIRYLDQVITATENIYTMDDQMIELPNALQDVENRMNQIKFHVRSSEQAARDAEQRKNDLIVYLAHDLKTPLTSVIGYLTLLHDEQEISPALREKYLSITLEKAERLEDLINEFFDITRFSLSHLTLELCTINLSRMLEQTVFEFKPMFDEKGLTCRLNIDQNLSFRCDPDKLQRVFDNLLRNAVNYSFPDTCIQIDVVRDARSLHIFVKNQGNTIPREKLDRIFEQFFRLDSSRASRSGGAGLGLAIAREIVELHHGTITAQSHDDMILFEVTLPLTLAS